eukprot:Hpha_TRINITY_DN15284_c8_g1::TRINITY_DN15284_c8_g1_i1::g.67127::m.67127
MNTPQGLICVPGAQGIWSMWPQQGQQGAQVLVAPPDSSGNVGLVQPVIVCQPQGLQGQGQLSGLQQAQGQLQGLQQAQGQLQGLQQALQPVQGGLQPLIQPGLQQALTIQPGPLPQYLVQPNLQQMQSMLTLVQPTAPTPSAVSIGVQEAGNFGAVAVAAPAAAQSDSQDGPGTTSAFSHRILLLKHVGITADVNMLIRIIEDRISPGAVEEVLEVWTKGVLLMRTNIPVEFMPERIVLSGTRGVTLEVVNQQTLSVQHKCAIVNAKFFIAHPRLDFTGTGTAEELAVYESLAADWADRPTHQLRLSERVAQVAHLGKQLEALSGVAWHEMLLPHYPRKFNSQRAPGLRRMYTQLVFNYKTVAQATQAIKAASGSRFKDGPLTIVVRLDYGDPAAIASAPRVLNESSRASSTLRKGEHGLF